jgi:hypothetical protein
MGCVTTCERKTARVTEMCRLTARPRGIAAALPAVLLAFALAPGGCGGKSSSNASATSPASSAAPAVVSGPSAPLAATAATQTAASWPCDDQQFLRDQQQFAQGALEGDREVDVCGRVTGVLPERETRSGLHAYFYLQVAPGDTIEIVSDLDEMDAPAWPWVKAGDYSFVQGRYYYDNPSSQGIDWTHHGTSPSWPTPGYVVIDGTEYQ